MQYVCRSSTLSSGAELYGRSGLDWLFTRGERLANVEIVLSRRVWVCTGNDAATATDDSDSLKSIARS